MIHLKTRKVQEFIALFINEEFYIQLIASFKIYSYNFFSKSKTMLKNVFKSYISIQ